MDTQAREASSAQASIAGTIASPAGFRYRNRVKADELISDALVNQDNYHWSALVKHNGLLWNVDSKSSAPTLMTREAFSKLLLRYPDTFAVARQEHTDN